MMDIFIRFNRHDEALAIAKRLSLSVKELTLMIKNYGQEDRPDLASAVFESIMLREKQFYPDVLACNTLINAWAESSKPDTGKAVNVLRFMDKDLHFLADDIHPDAVTFGSLLKCLSKTGGTDAGEKAIALLDDMECRYHAGQNDMKPDAIVFTLAIKSCLCAKDYDRFDELMKRMEKSDTPPTIRTYTDILEHWSRAGTTAAAQRCEQILNKMIYLSRTKDHALKPDVFAFNIALTAWSRSGAPDACHRMWEIYERMGKMKIHADMVTFNTMISFLSKSTDPEILHKTIILLKSIENIRNPNFFLDFRHFAPLLNGFCVIGNAQEAEKLLLWWIRVSLASGGRAGNIPPSHFDKVTKAWIRSGNLPKATRLVYRIQELYGARHLSEGPSLATHEILCAEWGRSKHPQKFQQLYHLRKKIDEINAVG